MSRGVLLVVLGLVPLARALGEAYDAAADLGGLLGPGRAVTEVGGWELGVLVGHGVGLGFVVDRAAAGSSVAEPARTEGLLYLGPVTVTAARERLPEVAPLVGKGVAA